ncbi:transcriptional regulator [Pseudomonas sp. BF-B-25]|uniref:transcriptional regulator n=1 Tax=Pseudomonas sp. BF-B-25 TaxID=2832355 RepID=UPI001CBB795C|nr:transcriptional regulator [Pseudomonas sp. BF-B-25]
MYHYVESGLPNVWLSNGFVVKETSYGEAVAITDVQGLHDTIGKALAEKPAALTGAEFRFLRKELGLSQERLGAIVGLSSQAVAIWEKSGNIPTVNDRYLRGLYLEAKTGEADLMAAINKINDLDHDLYKLNLEFEGTWHNQEKACA